MQQFQSDSALSYISVFFIGKQKYAVLAPTEQSGFRMFSQAYGGKQTNKQNSFSPW